MRMKNPFLIAKFFGQNIADSRLQPGGRFEVVTNIAFLLLYSISFIVAFNTMENMFGDKLYGFISKMKFAACFYEMGFLLCYIIYTTMTNRTLLVTTYHLLVNQYLDLKKLDVKIHFDFIGIYVVYFILFSSSACVLIYDLINTGSNYSLFFWISLYLPGLSCCVYILQTTLFYKGCTQIFASINEYLDEMSEVEKEILSKLEINKRNERPKELFQIIDKEGTTIYEKLFIIHDKTCEIAKLINDTTGYEYFVFLAITTNSALSIIYDKCMDLIVASRGGTPLIRSYISCDYWSLIHTMAIVFVVSYSSDLMNASNSTKYYLHKLRNIYPQMDEHFELISLQLFHQELDLTAAKCFTLDKSILYNIALQFATYIIILADLDTESDEEKIV